MCDKVVSTYPSTIKFVPECFMTQEISDQSIDISCICSVFCIWFLWQRCFWRSFLIVYCPDGYKTQRICDEAFDDSLAALKLTPDWFVTTKIIKKLYTAL